MLSWALLFGAATAASPEFSAWAKEFGKLYKDEAAALRAELTFLKNAEHIAALNANPDDSAVYGHTLCFFLYSELERIWRLDNGSSVRSEDGLLKVC